MDKLSIQNEMMALDSKSRTFFTDLTDEERKKFSNFTMIRWASSVTGSADMQEFYLVSTNERLNKHFFTINKHPHLQWLCATAISPGLGNQRHQWIASKKKEASSNNETKKLLMAVLPNAKIDEIELLAKLTSNAEMKEIANSYGL
jgi:hypothetical protein